MLIIITKLFEPNIHCYCWQSIFCYSYQVASLGPHASIWTQKHPQLGRVHGKGSVVSYDLRASAVA